MLYFFGPILIIISVNIVLFILTSLKIHSVQKEMAKITAKDDSKKNLNNEKDRFVIFENLQKYFLKIVFSDLDYS